MTDKKGDITVRNGKANRYRDIPLNKDARSGFLMLGYEDHTNESIPVIEGQRGYLNARGIQLLLKRRFQYTELEFISPHLLRHTFCKNLVDANIGLEKIALLAGHESLDTTRLYCQPSFDDLTDSVEKIGEEE
jgi:integrase/recombinase XerC